MNKKKMLLLGDSISLHYGPYLAEFLKEHIVIHSKPGRNEALNNINQAVGGNGGDSSMVLDYLREREAGNDLDFDVVVFNCGLHDIKRKVPEEKYQVPIEQYQDNIEAIYELIASHNIKTFFITSTPVDDVRHNVVFRGGIRRYDADVVAYNEVAVHEAKLHNTPVIDLYQFTRHLKGEVYIDHVHFKEEVRELQAAFIAGSILSDLF